MGGDNGFGQCRWRIDQRRFIADVEFRVEQRHGVLVHELADDDLVPGGCHREILASAICRSRFAGSGGKPEVPGDFLAVVIEVPETQLVAHAVQLLRDAPAAQLDFLEALLHRQLEVEDALAAPAVTDPLCNEVGHQRGFLDHVADHPIHRLGGLEVEAVHAPVLDLPGVEQRLVDVAVVHGDHGQVVARQYPAPAAGRSPEVHRRHPGCHPLGHVVVADEDHEGLGELAGGS